MNGRRAPGGRPSVDEGAVLLAPRMQHRTFRGPEGIRAMSIGSRFEARDPALFEAEVSAAELGDLVLRRTRMTPHRAVIDGYDRGASADLLRFLTVERGALLVAPPGGRPVRLGVGDAILTCRPRTYAYRADDAVVVVTSMLPVSSLPATVRRLEDLPIGPLPHSPLVDAVVDLLRALATRLDEPWAFDAEYAARGLIDLETAILTEVIAPRVPLPGPGRVYSAAVDYMDRHLADPGLRPPQVAAAVGVSLRYLHRAFDDKEMTVARHLRERRLEQVATALRAAGRPPDLHLLAARFGFTSQDQLARAFRRRYGMSMTAYRSARSRQEATAVSSIGISGQSLHRRSRP